MKKIENLLAFESVLKTLTIECKTLKKKKKKKKKKGGGMLIKTTLKKIEYNNMSRHRYLW